MLINLFGNILVYFVVLKFRDMRIPMNHLLVNLAISDMMVGFLCAIFGQPFSTSNTTRTLEAVCHFGQRQTSLNTTASLTAKYSSLYLPWLWGFSILFSFINSGLKEKLRPRLWLNEQYSSTDVASPRWWSQWIWSTAFAGFQTVFFLCVRGLLNQAVVRCYSQSIGSDGFSKLRRQSGDLQLAESSISSAPGSAH